MSFLPCVINIFYIHTIFLSLFCLCYNNFSYNHLKAFPFFRFIAVSAVWIEWYSSQYKDSLQSATQNRKFVLRLHIHTKIHFMAFFILENWTKRNNQMMKSWCMYNNNLYNFNHLLHTHINLKFFLCFILINKLLFWRLCREYNGMSNKRSLFVCYCMAF